MYDIFFFDEEQINVLHLIKQMFEKIEYFIDVNQVYVLDAPLYFRAFRLHRQWVNL